jgi:5-formaminoimidazole-4-carboxamide-1-(beta)-D-ribofuranosyl 5'-monophosphate synthetase
MIERKEITQIAEKYNKEKIKIAAVASHSALDVFDGAVEEKIPTLAICKTGREQVYTRYFRSKTVGDEVVRGCVNNCLVFDDFSRILESGNQGKLKKENVLFIPNRSFSSYCKVEAIEDDFLVPLVGSRNMMRLEERNEKDNYYTLLEKGGLPTPKEVVAEKIDKLTIIKLAHAQKKLERGFFTASTYEEYQQKSENLLKEGIITKEALDAARVEEYVIGPVFNLDYFYSPLEDEMEKLELLGVDYRFESSLDGHVRLPADQQLALNKTQKLPEYTVVGHANATIRESLLEKVFDLGEKFIEASKKHYKPGVIGPFCLQTCVDKDMNFFIYDVAVRVGGGTNVHMSVGAPYANTLFRKPVSSGRRLAMEIKRAINEERLDEIIT